MAETKTAKKKSFLSMEIGGGRKKDGGGKKPGGNKSAGAKAGGARSGAGKKLGRGKYPVKTSINLIIVDENKINPVKAIVLIAIIVVAAGAFSKFMIIDRLTAMSEATGRVSNLRTTLQSTEDAINSFGELQEAYAHYTYSGMTEDELGLVDRADVLELAETVFAAGDATNAWKLTGNTLTAQVTGKSLQELNQLAQLLEQSPIVDRCAITNANKNVVRNVDRQKKEIISTDVTASLIVYLKQPEAEEGDQP